MCGITGFVRAYSVYNLSSFSYSWYGVTGFVPAYSVYNLSSFSYDWYDVTGFVPTDGVYNLSTFGYDWYDVTGFVPTDGVYNLSTFSYDCTTSLALCQQVVCMPVDLQATSSVFVPADSLCVFLQAVEIVCLYGLFFQISCPGNPWYIVFSFVSAGGVGGCLLYASLLPAIGGIFAVVPESNVSSRS